MPSLEDLTIWNAADWEELKKVWRDLVGSPPNEEGHIPVFQGEQIELGAAGYVLQTWIIEAFRLSNAEIEPPYKTRSIQESTTARSTKLMDCSSMIGRLF